MKSDKRPFLNVNKWNSGKTTLKCEEWRLKVHVVKNGPKWHLSVKLASVSVTSAKSNIHGRPPILSIMLKIIHPQVVGHHSSYTAS